ncbi:MAG: site-specific integrase [Marinilabiliaceae bacterium]|nr:site-specific integrase [Marinilabiliaceae bacterium]
MKRALTNTKATVKLRKSEYHNEWYLIIESYPVFKAGSTKPSRVIEALNRTITTPIWDKTRTARTTEAGKTYKPKRDANGIIQCKSEKDQESCIFADNVRKIRQHDYDNAALYTDKEAAQAEQNARSQCNFIEYFNKITIERHKKSSESIIVNWNRVGELLKLYANSDRILFSQIDLKMIEDFRRWILTAPCGGSKKGTISQNTSATYFSIFKAGLKQAFIDGYLYTDMSAKVKGIQEQESRREHLTVEELNTLVKTECDQPTMKRAALFSALTGLRHCDIQKLRWSEIQKEGGNYRLNFTQQKTKGVEYMPISKQAYQLCGEPQGDDKLVFEDLPDPSWISRPLERWIKAAGITRRITFHCFRHTYATLQLAGGTDIYTVSKMLGHTNVRTTQIYAKVVDEKKEKAVDVIKIDNLKQ